MFDIFVPAYLFFSLSVACTALGGEPTDDQRRSANRVHPSLHIKLYLELREYQGQVHAEPIGSAGVRFPAVSHQE